MDTLVIPIMNDKNITITVTPQKTVWVTFYEASYKASLIKRGAKRFLVSLCGVWVEIPARLETVGRFLKRNQVMYT